MFVGKNMPKVGNYAEAPSIVETAMLANTGQGTPGEKAPASFVISEEESILRPRKKSSSRKYNSS